MDRGYKPSEPAANSWRFVRYQLRTTEVDAARAFYTPLLDEGALDVALLEPERGAVPHWLGHLGVDDVESAASAFVARGAMRLAGAPEVGPEAVVLRDPGGAGLALAPNRSLQRTDVVWHQLQTRDLSHATADYCALFGWRLTEIMDLGLFGRHQQFSWSESGRSVGSMADRASLPGIHTHWLFYFRVADMAQAAEHVRAHGGLVTGPTTLPSGVRIAICDDPQGAHFGLMESNPQ